MTQTRNQDIKKTPIHAFSVAAMQALIDQWEHRAGCKFQSANVQSDESASRFIDHDAACYFNCAQELRAALASTLHPSPEQDASSQFELWGRMAADLKAIRAQGEAIAKYSAILSKAVSRDTEDAAIRVCGR